MKDAAGERVNSRPPYSLRSSTMKKKTSPSRQDNALRMQAEQEIRDVKYFTEAVFKTIPDGIVLTDHKGYITRVNKAVEVMSGFTGEELTGRQHDYWLAQAGVFK
jgi:PAS domain-containing protein